MIRMERIQARNPRRIVYRGTLIISSGESEILSNPLHIVAADASVPTPNGWTVRADRQCMLTVVNKILRQVKKAIVRNLMDRFEVTGSFDTTDIGDTQRSRPVFPPEHLRGYEVRQNARPYSIPRRPFLRDAGRSEAYLEQMRRAFNSAALAIPSFNGSILFKRFQPKRNTPERRAMALLARKIGKARYRDFKKKGYFEEQGKHGVYRFHKDKPGGVTWITMFKAGALKERPVMWDLCVQSQASDLPPGDVILSRWLEWRHDEDTFLKTANLRNIHTIDEATENPFSINIAADSGDFRRNIEILTAEMLNSLSIRPEHAACRSAAEPQT